MVRLLKRVYVESTATLGLVLTAVAVVVVVAGAPLGWLGVVLAWLGTLGYYGYLLLAAPSTRSRHLWPIYLVNAAGVVVAATAGARPLVFAGLSLATSLVYAYWYSRQHAPRGALALGQRLPEFSLTALDGSTVSSTALRSQPFVILFYRGNWCPFCMVQVQQLADQYRELHERGVGVALISPQRASDTAELAARLQVPMQFFSDTDGAAARALDLTQSGGTPMLYGAGTNGDTVVPTVVITDATGVILWLDHADNHRIRPEPAAFLEVLDRAGITA
jgi:peroxiredoxin